MSRYPILFCLLAAVLLSACQGVVPLLAPTPTAPPQPTAAQPTAQPATATLEPSATPESPTSTAVPPTNTPQPPAAQPTAQPASATLEPSATPESPTNTAMPPTTNTLVPPANTPTPPAVAQAAAPTDTSQPTNRPAPAVVVKSTTLNVRRGPGTNFGVLTAAKQGDTLNLVGQVQNCAWFKVTTAGGLTGWVIGGANYVTATVACAAVPAVEAPPTPVPPPPTAAGPEQPAPADSQLPADKGCVLFENFLGVELNVTLNGGSTAENFKVAPMGNHLICLNPGHYDYTLDAPPPWGSSSGSFDAEAGKHFRFPVEGRP